MLDLLLSKLERSETVEVPTDGLCVVRVSKPGQKTYALLRDQGRRVVTCHDAKSCVEQSGQSGAPVLFDPDTSSDQYVEIAFVEGAWRKIIYEHGRRYVFLEASA